MPESQPSSTFCFDCGQPLTGTKQFCSACGAEQKNTFLTQNQPAETSHRANSLVEHLMFFVKGLVGLIVILALIGIGWLLIDILSKKMGFQGESLVIPYLLYLFAAVFFGLAEIAIAAQKGFDPQRGQLSKIVILICTFVPPMQLGLIYFFGKNIDRYFAERNLRHQ